jgi:hypothetical protein
MSSSDTGRYIAGILVQLTASPDTSSSKADHVLSFVFYHSGHEKGCIELPLTQRGPTVFQQKNLFKVRYRSRAPDDALIFTFSSKIGNSAKNLARVSIPLERLPDGEQIEDSFQMEPLVESDVTPRIFLRLCDCSPAIRDPFGPDVPFGLTIPRQQPTSFTADHKTQEFGSPSLHWSSGSVSAVLLASFSCGSFSISSSPMLEISSGPVVTEPPVPMPCFEEEEETPDPALACFEIPADFEGCECEWICEVLSDPVVEVASVAAPEPDRRPFVLLGKTAADVDRTERSAVARWEVVAPRAVAGDG